MNASLLDTDPEVFDIIEKEKQRQREHCLDSFRGGSVMGALGSVMQNKYSEGYPGARYYGGNEFIDQAETLCQRRALDLFDLDPAKWGLNVQALSGHLSHGFQTDNQKNLRRLNLLRIHALPRSRRHGPLYRPKVLIAGASAYPRNWEFGAMKEVASSVGAYLLADIAHTSGLVGAGVLPHPFDHADVVTTTTHKSLRGPRGAMIFYRKGVRSVDKKGKEIMYDLENPINASVFPGHQGGPHNHTITALAVALKQAKTPEFKAYQVQVLKNAKAMENAFRARGFDMVSGGTDTHLLLVDLRNKKIDGARVERIMELVNIAANKNTVPGDKSALIPHGLRMGSPAMTTRGLVEKDFETVTGFVVRAVEIAVALKGQASGTKLKDFKELVGDGSKFPEIAALKKDVVEFSKTFPTIGFEESSLRYK
ncbi:pyridoxal phosphate-dependent transferase [Chytriomyces cf. hyalinus JEL632]|nr:pyridoxal phosphate-dependent transferase [Chytriomyces cf. hyalinus JEL632]